MNNYIVTSYHCYGAKETPCNTEEEVLTAIKDAELGLIYQVTSPTGKDVSRFVMKEKVNV